MNCVNEKNIPYQISLWVANQKKSVNFFDITEISEVIWILNEENKNNWLILGLFRFGGNFLHYLEVLVEASKRKDVLQQI